jgi:beta-lactamase regulating signal transducer with metallopeptidase domain
VGVGNLFGDKLTNVNLPKLEKEASDAVTIHAPLIESSQHQPYKEVEPVEKAAIGHERQKEQTKSIETASIGINEQPNSAAPAVSFTWQAILFLVWAIVLLILTLLLIQRAVFVSGLVRQADLITGGLNDLVQSCCIQLGIKGKIKLKASPNATSPAVCGLFRPVILLPQNLLSQLSKEQVKAVMFHELIHIRRGDLWVNLFQTLLQIIYFYNPFLWLANAVIRRVREQAVDEAVQVTLGEEAENYPQILIDVAKMAFKRPALSLRLIGVVESKSALKGRIARMLSRPMPKTAKLGLAGLAAIVIIGVLLLPMAAASNKSDSKVTKEKMQSYVEDFFKHNYRDITARKTIEWGEPSADPNGNQSIRYKYEATIWNKDKVVNNEIFIFDKSGKFVSVKKIRSHPEGTKEWMQELVEEFFKHNYKDITVRKTIEWGEPTTDEKGNYSIRYKYEATIWDKDKIIDNKIFTFDKEGKFISVKNAEGFPKKVDESFKATLTNGVTVELVGICEHPSEGKQWWTPNGTLLKEAPYDKVQDPYLEHLFSGMTGDLQQVELALRMITPTQNPPKVSWRMESAGRIYYMERVIKDGRIAPQLKALLAAVSSKDETIEVKLSINDSWVTFKNVSLKPGNKTDVQIEVEKPAGQGEDKIIVPGIRVGNYVLGMSKEDVLKSLGKPKVIFYGEEKYTLNNLPRTYFMVYDDISFGIVDDLVEGVSALSPLYKFANGLGVGDSEQKIKDAFGYDFSLKEFEFKNFLTYENKGLVFEVRNDNKTVMELSVLKIADPVNSTLKPHVQIEVEKEKIAATKNLINLASVEPNDITLEQLVEILEAMESAIVDVTIDYKWDEVLPGAVNERPQYRLQTARPFCKRILFTKTTSSIEKTSYNGRTLKHLSKSAATVVEGRSFVPYLDLSPLGFSIFALGRDLTEINFDMSTPLETLRSKHKELVHLYNRIEKIDGFDTIHADLLHPTKQIYLRIYFSVEHGYTPVRLEYIRNGSEVASSVEVNSLQKVADGLWFPSSGIMNHYQGKTKIVYKAIGKIVINQGLREEDFALEFPTGTKVDDQVRSIKYIVTSTEVKNQNPAGQGEEQKKKLSFGPVIEITVNDNVSVRKGSLIDFDTGKLVSLPEDWLEKKNDEMLKWLIERGIDASGATRASVKGLMCEDMIMTPVANSDWDKYPPDQLAAFNLWEIGKAGTPAYMTAQGALPVTYIFKTREGGIGVLQITGFNDEPKGVKIRYKMVKKSAGQVEKESGAAEQLSGRAGEDVAIFNSYFPDDKSAGERLDKLFDLWNKQGADSNALSLTDQQILEVVRNGFRRTDRHPTLILGLVGNRYIWGKSPQNEDAIGLMYRASYSPDSNIRHYAEYFGLSVVERKSPEILKRLAQLCANYKGTDTGRIIWGVKNSNQVDDFIKLLQTYLNSSDTEIRKRAETVIKELEGKAAGQGGVENKAAEQLKGKADESLPAKNDLQNMINSAKVGETIIMPKGVFSAPISINKSLILKGEDANNCIIEVTANQPAVFIDTKGKGKVSIGNLTIKWQLATGDKNIENPFAVLVKDSKADFNNCTFLPLGNYQRSPVALRAAGFTNMTVNDCRFEGYGYTVQFGEGTSGTIQDSIVTKSGHQGISLYEGANVKIIGNIVAGSLYHGIRSTGGRLDARDNLIINNSRGVYLGNKDATGAITNNVIMGNPEGICGFANSQVIIANNVFAGSTYAGVDMRNSCRLSIRDNIFQNNETGLKLFKEAGGDNNKVYKNTFWKNKTVVEGFEIIPVFIEADPQFTDANNGDFSLKSGPVQEQKQGLTNPEVFKNLWRKWQKIKSENTDEKDFNQTNED